MQHRIQSCKSPLWCVALVIIGAVVCLILGIVVGIGGYPLGMVIGGAVGVIVGGAAGLLIYVALCYGRQILTRCKEIGYAPMN